MLEAIRLDKNVIALKGLIDGSIPIEKLLAGIGAGTVIDCGGVLQINSVGIRSWVQFFDDPAKASLKLAFVNFSITLVDQLNMIRNFAGVVEVVSVLVPFRCALCNLSFSKSYPVTDLSIEGSDKLQAPCTKCGVPAAFDDEPEEFFMFLNR